MSYPKSYEKKLEEYRWFVKNEDNPKCPNSKLGIFFSHDCKLRQSNDGISPADMMFTYETHGAKKILSGQIACSNIKEFRRLLSGKAWRDHLIEEWSNTLVQDGFMSWITPSFEELKNDKMPHGIMDSLTKACQRKFIKINGFERKFYDRIGAYLNGKLDNLWSS